jgi:TRAP-type C4-dicarboxylate transport system substrate-binding protein
LAGLKIRDIPPSSKVFERFGARIVGIPPTETYEALQRKTVDSAFMSGTGGKTFGYNEVCRYYVDDMDLKTGAYPLYCSKSKFEALPQNVKDVYYQLLKESPAFSGALWDKLLKQAYDSFDKNGLERIIWSDEENRKLLDVAKKILLHEFVEPFEKKGLPGRKVYNSAIEISKKYGIKGLPTF